MSAQNGTGRARQRGRGVVARGAAIATLVVTLLSLAPASQAMTLADNDKLKLDMEVRLMVWALDSGPEPIPGLNSAPPPAQDENINDFFVRRARVIFRAQLSKSLDVYVQLGQDNIGSKILRDDAGFRFKDALINYKKWDSLQALVGMFKVPFLRENLQTGFNQLLVDRSLVTALRPATEGSRDVGGMVWGNKRGLQYRVAVFDGSDQEDTNTRSSMRGSARVSWNWFTTEPGLGMTGTTFGQKRILQVAVQGDAQNNRTDTRDEAGFTTQTRSYRNWAVDVFYDQPFKAGAWALTVQAAALHRRDDYDAAGIETKNTDGTYVEGGVLFPFKVGPGRLQFVGRYETIDIDRGATNSELNGRTIGVTWFTKGHERKIQADYTQTHERPTDLDDDVARVSFVATF